MSLICIFFVICKTGGCLCFFSRQLKMVFVFSKCDCLNMEKYMETGKIAALKFLAFKVLNVEINF